MCHRVSPLMFEELQLALDDLRVSGRARVPRRKPSVSVPDAYPGKEVPLFVADQEGGLQVASLVWGFQISVRGKSKLVFNTRMETALSQSREGRGLWANAMVHGRCLVPVRGFYESWTRSRERRSSDVRFTMPGREVFLLAAIFEQGRFSVVTTRPNADVAPIHSRMPLVLGLGESSLWLGGQFGGLQDRSGIRLEAMAED